MFYEFVSKVTTIDRKGNDKEISEQRKCTFVQAA